MILRSRLVGMRRDGRIISGRYRDVVVPTDDGWRIVTRVSSRRRRTRTPTTTDQRTSSTVTPASFHTAVWWMARDDDPTRIS